MFSFEIQRFTEAVRFEDLQSVATRVGTEIAEVVAETAKGFKSLAVEGNTVKFYTVESANVTTDTQVAGTFDFPEEIFLDQTQTTLVENFAWSSATYPGSTNPNLDGKVVFVLAVKGNKTTNPTLTYSFVNLEKLVDIYTAADNTITISGYTVAVKISAAANNAITVNNDGLHVDISGKADKVANATAGNIATLDANGNLVDSGYTFSTAAQTTAMLNTIFGTTEQAGD